MSADSLTYGASGALGGREVVDERGACCDGGAAGERGAAGYEATKFDERAKLLDKQLLCQDPCIYRYRLQAPKIAQIAGPGQFVSIKPENARQFLRIPLAVYQSNKEQGCIDVAFQVLGKGTSELAGVDVGKYIFVQGPLGNGWSMPFASANNGEHHTSGAAIDVVGERSASGIDNGEHPTNNEQPTNNKILLIAGGMGAVPLFSLAEKLKSNGYIVDVVLGAANKDLQVFESSFEKLADNLYITTDDGSVGTKGFVTAVSDNLIAKQNYTQIYMCGPYPMMAAATKAAHVNKTPCQVSLERLMACGVGVCLSCVTKTTNGIKRVCADGPVFDAKELLWN